MLRDMAFQYSESNICVSGGNVQRIEWLFTSKGGWQVVC